MEVIKGFGEGRRAAAQTFKSVQEERLSEQKRSVDKAITDTESHARKMQLDTEAIKELIQKLTDAVKVI
jgi:hypothetical protein